MYSRRVIDSLAIVALVSWLLFPAAALARPCARAPAALEPTPEARAANDLAVEMANREQYVEALALFRKAYELSPSHVILFNIGRMAEQTGDPAGALWAYRCHVEDGGNEVSPERKAQVEAALARLRLAVGELVVKVDQAGASIAFDGEPVGTSPLEEPLIANPGVHRLLVRGASVREQEVKLEAGKRSEVAVLLEAPSADPPEPKFRFPEGVVGTAWVVTGLAIVSASVTGALALVGAEEVRNEVYLGPQRRPGSGSPIDDKVSSTESLAAATDVLIAVGAVSASAAITFSVVNLLAGQEPAPARIGLAVGPAGFGLTWTGRLP